MAEASRRTLGQLSARPRGRRTHICSACDFPIAVYGRCAPCLHVFCLTCAAGMSKCIICGAAITKLERIPAEAGLFISPLTLQGFRTEADLAAHAYKMAGLLAGGGGAAGGGMAGMAGMGGMGGMAGMPGKPSMQPGMPSTSMLLAQMQQQAQMMRAGGWKPPPPPGSPPRGAGGAGHQQQQRHQAAGQQRMGQGVMRPR